MPIRDVDVFIIRWKRIGAQGIYISETGKQKYQW